MSIKQQDFSFSVSYSFLYFERMQYFVQEYLSPNLCFSCSFKLFLPYLLCSLSCWGFPQVCVFLGGRGLLTGLSGG